MVKVQEKDEGAVAAEAAASQPIVNTQKVNKNNNPLLNNATFMEPPL